MFNPEPRVQEIDLGAGQVCWIVDDFLREPQALVQQAVAQAAQFRAAPFNAYPGLEQPMTDVANARLSDFFTLHIRARLGGRRTLSMYSRLSLATLQPPQLRPLQRLCHRDRFGTQEDECVGACTAYLFADPGLGGTSFFRPRLPVEKINSLMPLWNAMEATEFTAAMGAQPGYLTQSNAFFELLHVVPAAFNRAVFYDGGQFHSSHIEQPQRLSADPAQGRLTLNGFFICRRRAG